MDRKSEIKRRLLETVGMRPNLPITAEVVAVQDKTCSVKLASGMILTDVRLTAIDDQQPDGLIVYPMPDSEVLLISQTGELSGLVVIKVNTVAKIVYKAEDFEFAVDGLTKMVTIKNGSANVGTLIGLLIQTIATAMIDTPDGPSTGTISPATGALLEQIKAQFSMILST